MHLSLLYLIVFINGAVVMVFELAGSRLVAPQLGTSTYVWTSIIGIILGSLAAGSYAGGRVADRRAGALMLPAVLMTAALCMAAVPLYAEPLLTIVRRMTDDMITASILAAVPLFAPVAFFAGMVTPLVVRRALTDISHGGRVVGTLGALATVGSIVGTFLAGFVLIPLLGTRVIVAVLALVTAALAVVAGGRGMTRVTLAVLALTAALSATAVFRSVPYDLERDTAYSHVRVYETTAVDPTGRPARVLQLNAEAHSAVYADGDPALVFDYTRRYDMVRAVLPPAASVLMIGGGAYTYPAHLVRTVPDATIDVVEIDPTLEEIATAHFGLQPDPRLRIVHEDGRPFLDRTIARYDAILLDAFTSYYAVPFQLTTREAAVALRARLTDDGLLIANVVGTLEGENARLLRALVATYATVFPAVALAPVETWDNPEQVQNIMLLAATDERTLDRALAGAGLPAGRRVIPAADAPVMTDDFAPVDYYMAGMLHYQGA